MLIWYKKQSAGQSQRGRPSSQVIWPGAPWCSAATVYSAVEKKVEKKYNIWRWQQDTLSTGQLGDHVSALLTWRLHPPEIQLSPPTTRSTMTPYSRGASEDIVKIG